MQETATIRLLIVDDHEVVRVGLRTLLESAPGIEVIGDAGTVASAVEEAARTTPDVILLDVRLPDGTGFDACRKIQEVSPHTRILILTSFADDDLIFQAISAGVDGYLLKEIDAPGLVQSITKVASGQSILDPSVTKRVLSRIKSGSEPKPKGKIDLLSPQERRILARVARGLTNKEIAADLGLSDKTVKNYLSNAMEKLQMSRRSQAAAFYVQNTHS